MLNPRSLHRFAAAVPLVILAVAALTTCAPRRQSGGLTDLARFAKRYAAAWSSQEPDTVASFYAENGSLTINRGTPAVGRAAIRATAEGFMTAFPNMVVIMDSVVGSDHHAVFYWTWTGTNTGPGGTGREVRIRGYEEWTFDSAGLILASLGNYDEAEYQRQVSGAQ